MKLAILGTRGIPAQHGGFETFAERLALYLVSKGWSVTVYCPATDANEITETSWNGVRLLHVPVRNENAFNTIVFDFKSTLHAIREKTTVLNLGYGSAFLCFLYRLSSTFNLINMDGVEWRREKWSLPERTWLYLNERLACWFAHHLIADHPEIKRHLATRVAERKITMIPYGADPVLGPDAALLEPYELEPSQYALIIARPDPDNSILEIVTAFSRKKRGLKLAVLGNYEPTGNAYHCKVTDAASNEVMFLGGVYDKPVVEAIRFHARLYIHGHRVGGTNPSLVEALAAGSPVLAHDNPYNRWVAAGAAHYFRDQQGCSTELDGLLHDRHELEMLRAVALERHKQEFLWEKVLGAYETLLARWQQPF